MDGLLMKYFVLKPRGTDIYAAASRRAMHAYAQFIMNENSEFAIELANWAAREGVDAHFPEPASGIEAPSGGETRSGSTEGESPAPQSGETPNNSGEGDPA